MPLSGKPGPGVAVPAAVRRLAGGRQIRPVWLNQAGGLTVEAGDGQDRCFIKWSAAGDFSAEEARMEWAAPFAPVPRVLGRDDDGWSPRRCPG